MFLKLKDLTGSTAFQVSFFFFFFKVKYNRIIKTSYLILFVWAYFNNQMCPFLFGENPQRDSLFCSNKKSN